MPNLADTLADQLLLRDIDLSRFEAAEQRRVLRVLEQLQRNIIAQLNASDPTGVRVGAFQRQRLEKLLPEVTDAIRQAYTSLARTERSNLRDVALLTGQSTAQTVNAAVGVELLTAGLSEARLRTLVDDLVVEGAPAQEWWSRQAGTLRQRWLDNMRQGIALGEQLSQLISRTRRVSGVAMRHAETLVRTSLLSVANTTRDSVYVANSDVLRGVQWIATLDTRTCIICRALSGKLFSLPDHQPIGHTLRWPGVVAHMQCVPGDSRITFFDRCRAATKRWTDGELITIRTASGELVSTTTNHPILTEHGWIPACELQIGMQVVKRFAFDKMSFNTPNDQDVITSAKDGFDSFLKSSGVIARVVPISSVDFHGDGSNSKVAIIATDSSLCSKRQPAFDQPGFKNHLCVGTATTFPLFLGDSLLKKNVFTARHSTDCIMCGLCLESTLHRTHLSPLQKFCLALSSQWDSCGVQSQLNNIARDIKLFGNSIDRHPSLIQISDVEMRHIVPSSPFINTSEWDSSALYDSHNTTARKTEDFLKMRQATSIKIGLDNIVRIDCVRFHGFTYNFETEKGFYATNNIITHNCRCTQVPVPLVFEQLRQARGQRLQRQLDELSAGRRRALDGDVAVDLTFEQWLGTQPERRQRQILGRGRFELWSRGELRLDQMVTQNHRPLTLDQLQARADVA